MARLSRSGRRIADVHVNGETRAGGSARAKRRVASATARIAGDMATPAMRGCTLNLLGGMGLWLARSRCGWDDGCKPQRPGRGVVVSKDSAGSRGPQIEELPMESRSASRRSFLRRTALGTVGFGPLGALALRAEARPTPSVGDPSTHARAFANDDDLATFQLTDGVALTRRSQEGPFYRAGAPYRCKVSPPLVEGVCLVIAGRVWGFDSKKPIPHAVIDLWHADVHGRYDNADGSFRNRARLITSETGAYEFETIHPTGYSNGPNFQRAPHIHFKVSAAGYRTLTSELFFEGDAHQDIDPLFKPELVVKMACRETARGSIECGQFDIVLEKA